VIKKSKKPRPSARRAPASEPPAEPPKPAYAPQCSFCGKRQTEVKKLIAGPAGAYICDECIALCRDICVEDGVELPAIDKTILDEKAKAASEEKAREAKARLAAKASDIQAAIVDGKNETAKLRARELATELGNDGFTKAEVRELLVLADSAHTADMSLPMFTAVLADRLALWERARPKAAAKDQWGLGASMMGLLGGGLLASAAMSYMAAKKP
jgi:hypothetical protein